MQKPPRRRHRIAPPGPDPGLEAEYALCDALEDLIECIKDPGSRRFAAASGQDRRRRAEQIAPRFGVTALRP